MKKITILGSTGKIGTQTLEIVRSYPKEFKIIGLACGHESKLFNQQVKEFKPKLTSISTVDGEQKLIKVASYPEADLVIVAVVGLVGLLPTLAAIKAKKNVAIATKEVLVIAGDVVMKEVKKYGVNLIPLDSEHSAIWQCLKVGQQREIKKLILTMGKGPIAKMSLKKLSKVTIKDIFNRQHWSMGIKIAVDSATGMNKTFEVIEASHLFGVRPEQIEIVVHPEYICHSAVEFVDNGIIAELGQPDMRRYLQYGLFYPERKSNKLVSPLSLLGKTLSFEKAPYEQFPCLKLGFMALKVGGTMSAVVHGADTAAVEAFLRGKIKFTDIYKVILLTMKNHKLQKKPQLKELIMAEQWGQTYAQSLVGGR